MTTETLIGVLALIGAGAGGIFALGKWASRRETASDRIRRLEEWRTKLPAELEEKFVRKEVLELRLQSMQRTSEDTHEKVAALDDKMDGLLVALAQRGDIERRRA